MSKVKDLKKLRTWIEVDTKALAHNFRQFKKFIGPKVQLMAVVKSNAYGHGLIETSEVFARLGADWLGVDSITEALALRRIGIKTPILVLGYTLAAHFDEAARKNITLTVSQLETAKELVRWSKNSKTKGKISIHLKVDTGMHRQGFLIESFAEALATLKRAQRINITGLYSHLAAPGNEKFAAATAAQKKSFELFRTLALEQGLSSVCHLNASGGSVALPEYRYDLCRFGIGLYGLWPNEEVWGKHQHELALRPALVWKTIISEIKIIPQAGAVGYDFTEEIAPGTRLAILPVGYWHGFPRHLSGRGRVLVRGESLPVVGRVSMDMIIVKADALPNLKVGEEVVLIGEGLTANEFASLAETSRYEIVTRLNPLIWRVYR